MRLQDKYLHVSKRNKIIHLLKDKNDMALTIEIIEFLRVNPKYWKKIRNQIPRNHNLESDGRQGGS